MDRGAAAGADDPQVQVRAGRRGRWWWALLLGPGRMVMLADTDLGSVADALTPYLGRTAAVLLFGLGGSSRRSSRRSS